MTLAPWQVRNAWFGVKTAAVVALENAQVVAANDARLAIFVFQAQQQISSTALEHLRIAYEEAFIPICDTISRLYLSFDRDYLIFADNDVRRVHGLALYRAEHYSIDIVLNLFRERERCS